MHKCYFHQLNAIHENENIKNNFGSKPTMASLTYFSVRQSNGDSTKYSLAYCFKWNTC
jgi:hypothetical protein